MNHPAILGLGTAVPPHVMTQEQAATMTAELCELDERQLRIMKMLYRKSGVRERHTSLPYQIAYDWKETHQQSPSAAPVAGPTTSQRMQLYRELALPLATEAVQQALTAADWQADEITHLVTVSCTGFHAPGLDIQLMQALEMRPTVQRVNVGFMGCHGAINGLRVCQGLAAAEPHARILLCAVELCCLHYRLEWDPEKSLGYLLFADGAAAMALGPPPEGDVANRAEPAQVLATGSCLIPNSTDAMSWRIGDYGYEMTLSAAVPDLITANLRPWLAAWLSERSLELDDIGYWAVHPGGPRILTAVEQSLELPARALDVSRQVLAELGNMSSPTVLFILDRYRRQKTAGPGVLLGFGPGLVAEVALLG